MGRLGSRAVLVLSLLVGLAPAGPAQEGRLTSSEAQAVFRRLEGAAREVLSLPAPANPPPRGSAGPASRAELIDGFHRLFRLVQPAIVFSPRPEEIDPTLIAPGLAVTQRSRLVELMRWGLLPSSSPLSARGEAGLTLEEFGDLVGFFVARIAELTHTPSTRWTPSLQREPPAPKSTSRPGNRGGS